MSARGRPVSEEELDDLGEYLFDAPLNSLLKRVTGSSAYSNEGRRQSSSSATPPNPFHRDKGGVKRLYDEGLALQDKDPVVAARMIRSAAEGGLPEAMNSMGKLYAEGVGVGHDVVAAAQWWEKAVGTGSVDAMSNMAMCLLEGTGTAKDHHRGVQLFQEAAQRGGEHGWRGLGLCYSHGIGVEKNEIKAMRFRAKADELKKVKKAMSRRASARVQHKDPSSTISQPGSPKSPRIRCSRSYKVPTPNDSKESAYIAQEANAALSRIRSRNYYKSRRTEALLTDIRPLEMLTRTRLDARYFFLQKLGYAKVMRVLHLFPDDRRLQELGIHILRNFTRDVPVDDPLLLAYLFPQDADKDSSTSPIAFIISVLQRHSSVQTIQAVGCSALAAFSMVSTAAKQRICDLQGLKAIVDALVLHPRSALVQEMGSRAICDLCLGPSSADIKESVGLHGGVKPLIDAIGYFSNADSSRNTAVVEQSCEALRNTCQLCKRNVSEAMKQNAIPVLLSAVRVFIRREAIVGWGLAALSVLRGSGETLLKEKGVDVLRAVLKQWSEVQGVSIRVLPVLALVASVGGYAQHKVGQEFTEMVLGTMRKFRGDERAVEYGCECLSEFCLQDYENQLLAVQNGAAKVLVNALVKYGDHLNIVETACAALYAVADENRQCGEEAIKIGGIDAVVSGLRRFLPSSASVVEAAAAALRVLGEARACQRKVNELKGADLLVRALKKYPESSGVAEQCAGGIAVLGRENEILKARLAEIGAVAALIASLKQFHGDPFVIEQCCAAVQCLAEKNAGISIMFVTRGIGEILARIISEHFQDLPENGSVLEALCDTFSALGSEHVSHKDIIGEEGAIGALVEVIHMSTYGDQRSLMSALSAISTLCSDSKVNRDRLSLCGGVITIVQVLTKRKDSAHAAELCCLALSNATRRHDRNRDDLLQSKGVEAILSAMKRFFNDESLIEQGCWTLAVACVNTLLLQNCVARNRGIRVVVDAMNAFQDSAPVQAASCALILSCAVGNEANQKRLRLHGGKSIIVRALQRHPASRKVILYGTHALRVLEDIQQDELESGAGITLDGITRVQSYTGPMMEPMEGDVDEAAKASSDGPRGRRSSIWRRRSKSSPVSASKWEVLVKRLRTFTQLSMSKKDDKSHLTDQACDELYDEIAKSQCSESELEG